MTKLSKPVARVTTKDFGHYKRPIVITLIPGTADRDAFIAMHLKGTREKYLGRVPDLFRLLALWHASKLATAKRAARKNGIPWRQARRDFQRSQKASVRIPFKIPLTTAPNHLAPSRAEGHHGYSHRDKSVKTLCLTRETLYLQPLASVAQLDRASDFG